jgi:1-acyl-sn-glycerol-3-phosphate acyltransferase
MPPAFSPGLLRVVHGLLPVLLRVRLRPWLPVGITHIDVVNAATLAQLYHGFQQGKLRFVMAFRHVEVDDPLCGLYLLSRAVPQAARRQGLSLQTPLHAHFLYDRGMPLWAGTGLGWALSRLGGISIRRGRQPDWPGLRQARKLLTQGDLPLVIAPEGATNGHSERVGPLEPGAAQLAFWGVEDLAKANRPETVVMVPINIQYRYVKPMWPRLNRLLTQLEQTSGLPLYQGELGIPGKVCYARVLRLGDRLLDQMEAFYRRVHHQKSRFFDSNPPLDCAERLQALLEAALQTSEHYFGLTATGNLAERCRRLEEAAWQDIYRDDLPDRAMLSPLERSLADWLAQAASLQMLHMRLVETFVAVDDTYLKEKPSFERCAEITLLMFDLVARLRGDQLPRRPRLGDRQATLTVGEPITMSDRWPQYQSSPRAARQAVTELTEELQQVL